MKAIIHVSRILSLSTSLCLCTFCACPALTGQEVIDPGAGPASDRQTFEDEDVLFLQDRIIDRDIADASPSLSSPPYRLEVAFYREKPSRASGIRSLAWKKALALMKKVTEDSPVDLLHHESRRLPEGSRVRLGDLQARIFIDHQWVEGSNTVWLEPPSPRALEQGLALRARIVRSTGQHRGWLDLKLTWQRFPKEVRKLLLGMDRSSSLEEIRARFFRAAFALRLGKKKAWLYRPGGQPLEGIAILILLRQSPATKQVATSRTTTPATARPNARTAWQVRVGKEQWTPQGAWTPVGRPRALATLDGIRCTLQEGRGQSYLADILVEVGLAPPIEQPRMQFLNQGLRVELQVQALGDKLWVHLDLRDRALDALRRMPLKASLHGLLAGPDLRERHLDRGFLMLPGERFSLGSGASVRVGKRHERTRLWLQIDPLPKQR